MTRDPDVAFGELQRGHAASIDPGGYRCPVLGSLLATEAEVARLLGSQGRVRVVLACDPGVQTGYVLAAAVGDDNEAPVAVATWLLGQRAQAKTRAAGRALARGPCAADHVRVVGWVRELCEDLLPGVDAMVCEDWFAGPNPGKARDIAEQFYYAKAAAQSAGLPFREVAHSTWKKSYLGRGNLSSAAALDGYCRRGFDAHGVERWDPSGPMNLSDDAAALGCASWWLSTEST